MQLKESNFPAVVTVDVKKHASSSICILTVLQWSPVFALSGSAQRENERMQFCWHVPYVPYVHWNFL